MVIHLGYLATPPPGHRSRHQLAGVFLNYYTCRHLLETGDCGAYAARPAMCRDFPYAAPCPYTDCSLSPEERPDVLASHLVRKHTEADARLP